MTAGAGCSWSASSRDSFVNVTPASGVGNGTVTVTVTANTDAARTGSAVIAGQTVSVSEAAQPCSYVLTALSLNVSGNGGSYNVGVTTGSVCTWSAMSNTGFITVTAGQSGTGNGTITISVSPSGSARTGTLTIAGVTVTINQSASTQTGTFAIYTSASKGWSSIQVSVDGLSIGTLTAYIPGGVISSCTPSNAVLVTTLSSGNHSFTATSNTGVKWSGTVTVASGVCNEEQLTCTNDDCSSGGSSGTVNLPAPVFYCMSNGTNSSVVIITNSSSYTLRFDFTGAGATSFTVGPNSSSPRYMFTAGQYQETVSAPGASNVRGSQGPVTVNSRSDCTQTWVVQ